MWIRAVTIRFSLNIFQDQRYDNNNIIVTFLEDKNVIIIIMLSLRFRKLIKGQKKKAN